MVKSLGLYDCLSATIKHVMQTNATDTESRTHTSSHFTFVVRRKFASINALRPIEMHVALARCTSHFKCEYLSLSLRSLSLLDLSLSLSLSLTLSLSDLSLSQISLSLF